MTRKPVRYKPKSRFPLLLIVIGIGLAIFAGIMLAGQIRSSVFLNRDWRTTVVLATDPVTVVSFPKKSEEKIILMTLPGNVYLNVPHGYGKYRLETVWRLSELENRPDLFAQTVEDLLGIRITAWVKPNDVINLDDREDKNLISPLKQKFIPSAIFAKTSNSNLNFWDKIYLSFIFWTARPNRWQTLDLAENTTFFTDTEIPGNIRVKIADKTALADLLKQKFIDEEIRRSEFLIEVRNTTSVPGLGQKLSQFLTNVGGKVIAVTNEVKEVDKCEVYVRENDLEEKIVRFMKNEFGCQINVQEVTGADMVVYAGADWGNR